MNNMLKKLTITLMAAGTLFATSVSASADTTVTNSEPTSSTLVNKVTRDTNLATGASTHQPKHNLTPQPTKLIVKSSQNQVLATIDASSQSITKMKYLTNAK
ncbi:MULTISPECIES: hypothetical protein [Lactiplantibacillus]|uniref:Extracellular protein n=1 Tax=Lactiplantibacillus paraplantarum TaxID=60520 RepID=A0A098R8H4_9LACO|nr:MULTISPECIES: hypothetical protein [Lactiplantibacillus]OAX75598.1 hypothetical protein A0U96_11240 [Lactiplantibacillus plantarum]ALO03129.1 hypothetical protein ASU28_01510 [Lactiplantibacillus paraplantarum]AVW09258.1 hypothetical protein DA077_01270 [Lactiplantibacillus paraplantarum]AYJ37525.1 hypothetical protein LP667_01175 [Lactiplantibacillus paraplantarum]ERL45302.1 extracellular protein [Lactiplantibacillus paraplantarum]